METPQNRQAQVCILLYKKQKNVLIFFLQEKNVVIDIRGNRETCTFGESQKLFCNWKMVFHLSNFTRMRTLTIAQINRITYHLKYVIVHLDCHLHKTISWHCWDGNTCGGTPVNRQHKGRAKFQAIAFVMHPYYAFEQRKPTLPYPQKYARLVEVGKWCIKITRIFP